jgi:KAP family P-loop domain
MWPDNETDVDLLGFDYLVDQLEVLLTSERLLPLTVLVSGDWGSGKSSLMEVARNRLETDENKDKFICVKFTPWRFEDFNYGKVALMAAVVDAIADYAEERKGTLKGALEKANTLRRTLHRWGVWKNAAAVGAALAGAGPEEIKAAEAAGDILGDAGAPEPEAPKRTFETVAHFHTQFEELIESLGEKLQAVVVFIDDMDRCSRTPSSRRSRRCACFSTPPRRRTSLERTRTSSRPRSTAVTRAAARATRKSGLTGWRRCSNTPSQCHHSASPR